MYLRNLKSVLAYIESYCYRNVFCIIFQKLMPHAMDLYSIQERKRNKKVEKRSVFALKIVKHP